MKRLQLFAARTPLILFGAYATVQILVAIGVIPVTILWGGSQTELTPGLRWASLAAAALLLAMAYVIYKRSGLILQRDDHNASPSVAIRILAWVVTGYLALNSVGNFLSSNPYEQYVSGTLTVIMTIACAIISSSPIGDDGYQVVEDTE